MECPAFIELASARLDGELAPDDAARLERHLAACRDCAATVDALQDQHRRLRLTAAPPVPDLTAVIVAGAPAPARPARSLRWGIAAISAAAAAAFAAVVLLARPGAPAPPRLDLTVASVASAPRGGVTEVRLYLDNAGGRDRVVGVSSPVAARALIHRTEERDGARVMRAVTSLPIAGEAATELTGDGLHVMLVGLTTDLRPGTTIPITLQLQRTGTLHLTADVVAPGTSA